jgi:hypothetical protein
MSERCTESVRKDRIEKKTRVRQRQFGKVGEYMCKNKEKTEIWDKERNINLGEKEKGKIQDTRCKRAEMEKRGRKRDEEIHRLELTDCTVSKSLQMFDCLFASIIFELATA